MENFPGGGKFFQLEEEHLVCERTMPIRKQTTYVARNVLENGPSRATLFQTGFESISRIPASFPITWMTGGCPRASVIFEERKDGPRVGEDRLGYQV